MLSVCGEQNGNRRSQCVILRFNSERSAISFWKYHLSVKSVGGLMVNLIFFCLWSGQ